mmetsp:Transcript_115080/g.367196  ORF Transcript_115080/g.367196 Transcript_115080/m.367196 type:complete len:206 (-) Transcript_115080:77-694(-)
MAARHAAAMSGSGHKSKRASMSVKEASERYTAELQGFARDFIRQHRDAFQRLTPAACKGMEEQEHQWHDVFKRFSTEVETRVQFGAEKWGLLQEPAFSSDFVEWAAGSTDLDSFLAATDYKQFLELVLRTLSSTSGDEHPGLAGSQPLPSAVTSIDERLAALEKERMELLRERKRLLGCGSMKAQTAQLQQDIARQRYFDDVGMD